MISGSTSLSRGRVTDIVAMESKAEFGSRTVRLLERVQGNDLLVCIKQKSTVGSLS